MTRRGRLRRMYALADRLHALCADFPQLRTQIVYLRATVNTLLLEQEPPPTAGGRGKVP